MCGSELFDDLYMLCTDGTWTAVECEERPSKRAAHGAVLHNRYIYIYGGLGDSGALMDVWRFSVGKLQCLLYKDALKSFWNHLQRLQLVQIDCMRVV